MFNPDTKFPQPITADNSGNFESAENEEENRKALEIRNKLIEEGKKYGNDFSFVEPAIKLKEDDLPNKINPKVFNGKINPDRIKVLESQLAHLTSFLSFPIIKDSFANDHNARREWRDKYLKLLSPESQECYRKNRLRLGEASQVVSLLNFLHFLKNENENINPEILSDLENIEKLIPEVIADNKKFVYNELPEEEKIKTIEDLAPIIENVIKIIGEPKETTKKEKERELEEELV